MTITSTAVEPGLFGRDGELEELWALLARARLITLTGPAGVGKSTLATALAADGRWAACAKADLLDAPDPAGAQELLRRTAARLTGPDEPRLLLLDNGDLVLGAVAPFATELLASSPGLRIVVTSREGLGVRQETIYQVGPLTPPDAAAFFVVRAGAQRGGVTPEISAEIRQICARLDGLPLALELAAAHTKVLTPAQILARLDDTMRLLAGGLRAGTPHHRSLRCALDWGAQTLATHEHMLLARVSVFADAFTLDAAERVCAGAGLDADEVLQALTGLVAKSLVGCDPRGARARYRLMRTVRQYAAQLLARSGEAKLMQWNRVDYAIRHPDELSVPDLTEALRWCADQGAVTDALRLAAAAAPFWLLAGRILEGAALLDEVLDRTEGGVTDQAAYTRVRLARAMFDGALGQADQALAAALETAGRCEQHGDQAGQLWAEVLAGTSMLHSDPADAARRIGAAAARLAAGSPWTPVATGLHALAAAEAGRVAEAQEAAALALAVARSGPLAQVLIIALLAAGRVARKHGRLDPARAFLDEAEAEALAAGPDARGARALVLAELCRLALDRGSDGGEAGLARLEQASALAAETGSPLLHAATLDVLGRSRLQHGFAAAARGAFASVTALSKETVANQAVAGILGLGQVALAGGSASAAWTLIEEAYAIARAGAGPALLARTLHAVGDCAWALGNVSRAWAAYHQALAVRIDAGLCVVAVESLESLASLALEQGRADYGVRLLGAVEGLREAQGSTRPGPAQARIDAAAAQARASLAAERFTELHAEGLRLPLREAAAYACRQRGPRQRGVGWVSLTPAERQVADLAATGLTNREIGERLFSSPRTVQVHLSHVFAKLGISSRKLLAAEIEVRNKQLPAR